MSISDTLQEMAQAVEDAKDAIEAKGGSVGNTGLAGLATEIANIPAGVSKDYGVVTIGKMTSSYSLDSATDCSVTITDVDKATDFLVSNDWVSVRLDSPATSLSYAIGASYNVYDGGWANSNSHGGGEMTYTPTEVFAENGISITINEGATSASFSITPTFTVDTSDTEGLQIVDRMDFYSLGYLNTTISGGGGGMDELQSIFEVNGTKRLRTQIVEYTVGVDVDAIPDGFLSLSDNLADLDISGVTSIGDYFLADCASFNESMTLPSSVTSIGKYFMRNCASFNQPFTIPSSVDKIGNAFLHGCSAFDQPITIPSSVTTIGSSFMGLCSSFNSTVTVNAQVESLASFMNSCTSFNQPITVPSTVTTLTGFLGGCSSFNSPITLNEGVKTLDSFLGWCPSFNTSFTLPSTVTDLGSNFLSGCSSFNKSIILPSGLEKIGPYFLRNCTAFNQDLALPSSITNLNTNGFMYCCNAMVSTLTVNTSANASATNQCLTTTSNTAPCYTTGIKVGGTYGSTWRTTFGNRTSSPYRRLLAA